MKNKFHHHSKIKSRKDSLVDFIRRFFDENKQVEFFISIKFFEGFVYDKCKCHEYYLIKRRSEEQIFLYNSNLSLLQILAAFYLFFTSNRGLCAPDLANNIDVSVKTARRYLRKFRILMAESNNEKNLESMFYETDIIEVGGRNPDGKRVKNFMFKHVVIDRERKVTTDNDLCFMWMKDYVELENSRVD